MPFVALLEYLRRNAGAILSIIITFLSFVTSFYSLFIVSNSGPEKIGFAWLSIGGVEVDYGFYFDWLSTFMATLVSFIGLLVLIYSLEYMAGESEKSRLALPRYYLEMTFFIGSMLGLVLSLNLLELYMFWEFVGLASYLLIGYWWNKPAAAKAAKKAFIVTRIGDTFLLTGIILTLLWVRTLEIPRLNSLASAGFIDAGLLGIISLLFFAGSMGKSAQFPLHIWLPDAMEGPTTVSALIHAATMVKAGVFLVARLYPVFQHAAPIAGLQPLTFAAYVGAFTSLIAGLFATAAQKIKEVLAYSTISHLGLMFLALGIGAYSAALFHLLNHAIFKALLFLVAGAVMHAYNVEKLSEAGGFGQKMRLTAVSGMLGALALSGIPPFNGFWSKEEIIGQVAKAGDVVLTLMGLTAAALSSIYIFRWWYLIFTGKSRTDKVNSIHESPAMLVPIIILAALTVVSGFFGVNHALTYYVGMFTESSFVLSILMTFLGVAATTAIYYYRKPSPQELVKRKTLRAINYALTKGLWIDDLLVKAASTVFASKFFATLDVVFFDGIVRWIAESAMHLSDLSRRLQTGTLRDYLFIFFLGFAVILAVVYACRTGCFGWGL